MVKKSQEVDYVVMPLEGLWWVDDMSKFSVKRKDEWKWMTMIMQPKYVTQDLFKEAMRRCARKKLPPPLIRCGLKATMKAKLRRLCISDLLS